MFGRLAQLKIYSGIAAILQLQNKLNAAFNQTLLVVQRYKRQLLTLLQVTNEVYSSLQTCNSNYHREEESHEERNENQNKLSFGERVKSHLDRPNSGEDNKRNQQWLKKLTSNKHNVLTYESISLVAIFEAQKKSTRQTQPYQHLTPKEQLISRFVQNNRGELGTRKIYIPFFVVCGNLSS